MLHYVAAFYFAPLTVFEIAGVLVQFDHVATP
jgi:hypothetical protein